MNPLVSKSETINSLKLLLNSPNINLFNTLFLNYLSKIEFKNILLYLSIIR